MSRKFIATTAGLQSRAALYLRVSTGRQAVNDLSIPDQRRQLEAYCESKGWETTAEYVEPGNTATDDRRPSFQSMIEAADQAARLRHHRGAQLLAVLPRSVPVRVLRPEAGEERRASGLHHPRAGR
ncbi:recombinase family protein [Brevundimonas sanguinis]|uniref:recombinase family protein n=1 Tax=Brevundimonas sanguinis TaxID=3021811 RepID=UPI00241589A6|nr:MULTISPECIES: recombinase family protein [Brevundimonas]